MSPGSIEENNPSVTTTSALAVDLEINGIRQGDDNAAQLTDVDHNSLVQAHAISDPIFPPVRLPFEILEKIFIECIPSLVPGSTQVNGRPTFRYRLHPQQVRARLGRVCRVWNAILNNLPGVWATLVLDNCLPALEIVSLWIKRSKSHPLDVSLQLDGRYDFMDREAAVAVVTMLRIELWRIRSFFAAEFIDYYDISPLFPPDSLTEAPIVESLTLQCLKFYPEGHLGWIHCPQLHTLTLGNCDKAVESLTPKPMENLRVLTIINSRGDNMLYIELLQVLPNLVSLTWSDSGQPIDNEIPRVALPSLKSLAFRRCHLEITTHLLRHLEVPSLEHLDLGRFQVFNVGSLNTVLDVICGDEAVQLRRLTLGEGALRGANFHAIWHHLKHLETLFINDASADRLFVALSPPSRYFSSVCPQLKTLELLHAKISASALADFVQRRVKSDLGDPAPGLVTCLKLSDMSVDKEVSAQLVKTHSWSVHMPTH